MQNTFYKIKVKGEHVMKKMIAILSVITIVVAVTVYGLSKFDNTTDNVVSESKTKSMIIVDENFINTKKHSMKARLVVENHNGFDINMFDVICMKSDVHFDIGSEGAYQIKDNTTYNLEFLVEFNDKIQSKDYFQ